MTALPTNEQIERDVTYGIRTGVITLPAQRCDIKNLIARGLAGEPSELKSLTEQLAVAAGLDQVLLTYYAIGLVHGMDKEQKLSNLFNDDGRPDDVFETLAARGGIWHEAHTEI